MCVCASGGEQAEAALLRNPNKCPSSGRWTTLTNDTRQASLSGCQFACASVSISPSPILSLPLPVCLFVCQVVLPIQISNLSGICNCIFAPSGIRNNLLALICQPARQPCRQPVAHVVNPILRARGPASRPCSCCCIFTVIENGIKCFANTVRWGRMGRQEGGSFAASI